MGVSRRIRIAGTKVSVMIAVAFALSLAGCATTQGHYSVIGQPLLPTLTSHNIPTFIGTEPERSFQRVCRLDAHLEKAFFVDSTLEDALPELKRQARLCGADAIIDIHQRRSMVLETKVLNVTAIGIRFTDGGK